MYINTYIYILRAREEAEEPRFKVHRYVYAYICIYIYTRMSDISSICHLVMKEFASGLPRYHLAIKGVREQFVIVEQNSGP